MVRGTPEPVENLWPYGRPVAPNRGLSERPTAEVFNKRAYIKFHKIGAYVFHGSVLGPFLWIIFFNDLLHLLHQVQEYADEYDLSYSYESDNRQET